MAIKFETQAMVLRRVAAELGHVSYREVPVVPAKKGKRKMSAKARALISKKLKQVWAERKAKKV